MYLIITTICLDFFFKIALDCFTFTKFKSSLLFFYSKFSTNMLGSVDNKFIISTGTWFTFT